MPPPPQKETLPKILASGHLNDGFVAFEWKIPIDEWYKKPLWAREAMRQILDAKRRAEYWSQEWELHPPSPKVEPA